MKRILRAAACVFMAVMAMSCDQILSLFDRKVDDLVGRIESLTFSNVKIGSIDMSSDYRKDNKLINLMKETGVESGTGKVAALSDESQKNSLFAAKDEGSAGDSVAKELVDLNYTDSILCVYFYDGSQDDDENGSRNAFIASYGELAKEMKEVKFYNVDISGDSESVSSIPSDWSGAAETYGSVGYSAIVKSDGTYDPDALAYDADTSRWKVVTADGGEGDSDAESIYIVSNSRVLCVISGRPSIDDLKGKYLDWALRQLSYRLQVKKLHWGAGYAIEDYLYDVENDEDFGIEVNFEAEKKTAEEKGDEEFSKKPHVAVILMYRLYPRWLIGYTGSYRTEDYMTNVLDKKTCNVVDNVGITPYDMNFVQRHADVKFLKSASFGADEEGKRLKDGKGREFVEQVVKRDYASYVTEHEDNNKIGYDWLIKGIEGKKEYADIMLDEDGELKEQFTRALCVVARDGEFYGIAGYPDFAEYSSDKGFFGVRISQLDALLGNMIEEAKEAK